MQHDLNLYKLQLLTFSTLATGINNSTSVVVDSASMGVILDISQLTGATSVVVRGQGSNDNTTFENIETTGATNITTANLDTDSTKKVFSVSSQGLFKYFRLAIAIVGTPTGSVNAVSYQIPQDGININANKK